MTLTPSENYARAKTISKFPKTRKFSESFPFELDDFQIQACHALEQGKGVVKIELVYSQVMFQTIPKLKS